MSIGERLRQAAGDAGLSIRAFQKAMEKEGVEGSSYPAVHRYLADETTPGVAFLEHAARVLRVRAAWLAFGAEPRTDADAAAAHASGTAAIAGYVREIETMFTREFPAYPTLSPWARAGIWEVITRWQASELADIGVSPDTSDHPDPHGFAAEGAFAVARTLAAPREHISADQLDALSPEAYSGYVVNVCAGLLHLVPTPQERTSAKHARERELLDRERAHAESVKANPEEAKRRREEERARQEASRARLKAQRRPRRT